MRLSKSGCVSYGIGDDSSNRYDAAVHMGEKLHLMYGKWTSVENEQFSNYRELHNLVNTVEKLYEKGLHKNCELFLYTDNSVTDCTYYRKSSSSRLLFLLILRLQTIQMADDLILHVIHISGRIMIECGVDGLSRRMANKGVMKGALMI